MSYFLRAWMDGDAGCDREISHAVYPEYREELNHPAWFPAQQLGAPAKCSQRYVAMESATTQRVAYAALWELRPRRYRFDLAVRPEWQRQGIANGLLSRVMSDARSLGATGLQARVRDDKPEALAFIQRRGFTESHRMGAYRVDFSQSPQDLQNAFRRLCPAGLKVTNLAEIRAQDPHSLEQLYELYSAVREGWQDPDPDPAGPVVVPVQQFLGWLDDLQRPEAFFVAQHEERYVGFTCLFDLGTAIHPSYRGRGIATWLKAVSLADAQRRGLQGQTTGTASLAMQKVLIKLDYRRLWNEIRLIREMEKPL